MMWPLSIEWWWIQYPAFILHKKRGRALNITQSEQQQVKSHQKEIQINKQNENYSRLLVIYSPVQIAEWRKTTDAVHRKNGEIFARLLYGIEFSNNALSESKQSFTDPIGIINKRTKFSFLVYFFWSICLF